MPEPPRSPIRFGIWRGYLAWKRRNEPHSWEWHLGYPVEGSRPRRFESEFTLLESRLGRRWREQLYLSLIGRAA